MFKNILLIGDSLTQLGYSDSGCWVALLADFYQRKCDIINRGFSGYTTRSIKPYVSSLVTEDLVKDNAATVIWLGANDSNVKELNEAQHVPLEEYKKNLKEIIQILVEKGIMASKILVVPPPPCNEEMWRKALEAKTQSMVKLSPKNNELTKLYYSAALDVARDQNCQTLRKPDLYWDSMNSSEKFCDGLHFSKQGAKLAFDFIIPELILMTKGMSVVLPDWKELSNGTN